MLPPDAVSLDEADAAIELWEHYKKRRLDPSQRLVVYVLMALRVDGLWAAATTGREMARQNGKGDEIEVVELWDLVQRAARVLHTIHDAVLLATETQARMLSVLEGHPDLRRKVLRVWRGTGQQMIEMRNGGIIWYRTRTGGGARGVDEVDRVVVDEAQHAEEEHISAISPTLLASVNPQLNAMGSAGITGKSVWWWNLRRRALRGEGGAFGYVGHTAEDVRLEQGKVVSPPVNVRDRALWARSNPVLVRRPELVSYLEEQLQRNSDELFGREHLCIWDPAPSDLRLEAKLPADKWAATVTTHLVAAEVGKVTVAFDVTKDGEWASIAVGLGSLQAPYVEVIEHRQSTDWLPARLVELVQRWQPLSVGCNGAGPAGAAVAPVLMAFTAAGIDANLLCQMPAREYVQACGGFFTDVVEGRLKHPPAQGPLDRAAGDAAERVLGDAWAWDRRSATVPISPLVAVTIARAMLPTGAEVFAGGVHDLDLFLED